MQIKTAICDRDINTEKMIAKIFDDLGLEANIDVFANDKVQFTK